MSTRVHELAKELGLKSQELLDLIQRAGFEVKLNPLASLDASIVTRIRELTESTASEAPTPSTAGSPRVGAAPAPEPPPKAPESPTISATVATPRESQPTAASTAPSTVTATSSTPSPSPTKPVPEVTPTPTGPSPERIPVARESAPSSSESVPRQPTVAPAHLVAQAPTTPPLAAAAEEPRRSDSDEPTRPGRMAGHTTRATVTATTTSSPAGGGPGRVGGGGGGGPRLGGPLSGHTGHLRQHPNAPTGSGGGQSAGESGAAGTLRRSDYISPTGTRATPGQPSMGHRPLAGRGQGQGPDSGQGPGQGQGPGPAGEQSRREGGPPRGSAGGRPLPGVATPAPVIPPRRPSGRPGGPEAKTQRPEVKYTPDQLRAMMKSGELGAGTAAPTGPGQGGPNRGPVQGRPGGPRHGHGPGAGHGHGPGGGPGQAFARDRGGPGHPGAGGPPGRRPSGPGFPGGPGMAPPAAPFAPPPAPPTTEEDEESRKNKGAGRLGSASERAGRRAKRDERARERRGTTSSVTPASALLAEGDEETRRQRSGRKGAKGKPLPTVAARKIHAEIEPPITLRALSEGIGISFKELMRKLMNSTGQLLTINDVIDEEVAVMLALEFGVELELVYAPTAEDHFDDQAAPDLDAERSPRPPIITILGHVDHGKTSLLDRIRKANVVETESGGITQHIGAYQVESNGHSVTFVDTPGHEAFTSMRARGANVTDIIVLVVAADDGVMPQTVEAIAHAKAAGVPIVVALNKIDLPNVNLNKIFGELSQQELVPEEYGGDTPVVKTSALTGQGIPELLEMLAIMAELRELKAQATRPAIGTCLEASLSEGRGVVATILVQDGTLRVGDILVCGDGFGRVRAMYDDKGHSVEKAGPSMPVEVSGLDSVPEAGEKFAVIDDISKARAIAEMRRSRTRGVALGDRPALTLENLYIKMSEQKLKSLNLIIKADVQGSLEALTKEMAKLENPEVPIRVLLKAVGGITESDVLLADASEAIIIGFRVAPEDRAMSLADEKKIDIRRYDIIYQVTDEVKKAIEGMLVPEVKEVHLGRAAVRQVFRITRVGSVAGCFVTQGTIERSGKARIIRDGREIYKGAIEALKRFKDDVKEVREGFECGIKIGNFDDLKVDDVIECYRIDVIRRTLASTMN